VVAPEQVVPAVDRDDIPVDHVSGRILVALLVDRLPTAEIAPAHGGWHDGNLVGLLEDAVVDGYVRETRVQLDRRFALALGQVDDR